MSSSQCAYSLARLVWAVALLGAAAVAGGPASRGAEPLFYPDDPIMIDDDTLFDAGGIRERLGSAYYDFIENTFLTPGENRDVRAMNINTADEVPDSSWFTNRLGHRPLSLEELTRGPNRVDRLSVEGWPIVEGKGQGRTPGWRVADPDGQLYQIEFDEERFPERISGAEVIGTLFYHAIVITRLRPIWSRSTPRGSSWRPMSRSRSRGRYGPSPVSMSRLSWTARPGSRTATTGRLPAASPRATRWGRSATTGRDRTIRTTSSRTSTAGNCVGTGCSPPG